MSELEQPKPDNTQESTPKSFNIEELRAAQQQHLQEQEAQRVQREQEAAEERERTRRLADFSGLTKRRGEIGGLLTESGYDAQRIEGHRRAISETLGQHGEKTAELDGIKSKIEETQASLEEIKGIAPSKNEAAPAVRQAWSDLEAALSNAEFEIQRIESEINALQRRAEDHRGRIQQFNDVMPLLDELQGIEESLVEYMQNTPEIALHVEGEARAENERREKFIDQVTEALLRVDASSAQGTGPERREVVKDLVTTFLNEDLENLGFDSIEQYDTTWFMRAFQSPFDQWNPHELYTLRTQGYNRYFGDPKQHQGEIDVYLKHYRPLAMAMALRQALAAGNGTIGTIATFSSILARAEDPGIDHQSSYGAVDRQNEELRKQGSLAETFAKHLQFLNAFKGAIDGSLVDGRHVPVFLSEQAAKDATGSSGSLYSDMGRASYQFGYGGPVIPRQEMQRRLSMNKETVDRATQVYEQYKQKLSELAQSSQEKRATANNEEKQALGVKAEALRAEFGRLQVILNREQELRQQTLVLGGSGEGSPLGTKRRIEELDRALERAKYELSQLSAISFLKKKGVQGEIDAKTSALKSARQKLIDLEAQEKDVANMIGQIETTKRSGRLNAVQNELRGIEDRLRQLG